MSNFDSLTKEEKKEVLKILNQISSNGNSTAYNTLLAADYDEIPVDIETFLKEPKYLGRGLVDNEGRFTVFPYWVDTLKKIYPDPLKPAKYNTLALTGCLSGDTKIKCLDGNSYTIKELFESEDFNDKWVYGYDLNKHTIVPDKIIAMKESGVQSLYRVTLDNGLYVDATLNHHFIARDGQVKPLSEFSVGDSLMPFNHDLTDLGYEQKIVSIEYIKDEMTYDLEIEHTHTFGLDCGIFIGNSIGIGKSFVAVLIGLYELYRMICLKDPYVYYGLQPIDKITFAVMNITLDASRGVAWDKMQQLLQSSEWFMDKGTVTGTVNEEWNPPKGIELIAGSLSRHIIGRAVFWCLDGETEIATNFGDMKLKDAVGKEIQVYNIDDSGNIRLSDSCTVLPTATESTEYQIELEDGTVIKCTPTHRFMLSDGTYKQAQDLTEEDDILEFKPLLKGKPSNKSPTKGKRWYNNGIKEILIENNPPEGYAKGRLKRGV